MMGDGYAIKPTNDNIYVLITNAIVSIFPTKHAISFKAANDTEILLHLEINIVELKGAPFGNSVKTGEKIEAGTLLGTMDRTVKSTAGMDDTLIVAFTNLEGRKLSVIREASVEHGAAWGSIGMAKVAQKRKTAKCQSLESCLMPVSSAATR
ncbi:MULTISPECIES: PTS glucose transporter subunit IIA [Lacticaseibacillus]|uniref:PTS glucose transporter subunit IIA n=2 Tax=Lacticaseibacillus TaxID=2759736 RepID=A0AAN1KET1_LACCA|nr:MULTISPECIES: PTS glucose transporter subunit IIA [Lacticaseibacillus]ARY92050.1 hypothetical protein BGL52_09900 [Lacticaseibacillus casei]KAB1971100.1 PTS glucose transporter subunit IIA [Lacticaseibacillus casei]WLV79954.1 PTS glucose transporter subunit IIA [Lacticaseibacillus sp. NCIMB 15473]WNX23914.1 PTS glucose transporter subunit IIA [Lacticaseibacillus casei]WNX26689.1 PTS glucose transporter subunit IIA [Lacticaseibacillus casei]